MKNYYYHTENDYTIKNSEGLFYAFINNKRMFIDDPLKSISLFKSCAEEMLSSYKGTPTLPEFHGCTIVKRDDAIEKYKKENSCI